MTGKSFARENAAPVIATVVVIAVCTYLLYQQGYFQGEGSMPGSMSASKVSILFSKLSLKMAFEGDDPELLAYAPAEALAGQDSLTGDSVPVPGSMVLGFAEGEEMASEQNLTAQQVIWGYEVKDFLGWDIAVTGVLKKTGTLIDMTHILEIEEYNRRSGQTIDTKFAADRMPKFFYYIESNLSNWPKKASKFVSGSLDDFRPKTIDGRTYTPLILGSDEAKMMVEEKIFSRVGDTIEGFFGKDVFVAGILAPTDSPLDMMHYMQK